MTTNRDLVSYYNARAAEYEKIYSKPERQEDLQKASQILRERFAGKKIIEVACGTGYWTEKIAASSASILATDINEAVIEIAKAKTYKCPVSFETADLYQLDTKNRFEGLFGGFIWSHILLRDLDAFIDTTKQLVLPGGIVVFMDNRFVEGSNHPITRTDADGNTYQTRRLEDGSSHEVLKNFPQAEFLHKKLGERGIDVEVIELTYFWIAGFRVN